ncbi:MAG: hypothetical protein P9X24_13490 [Candidatus Hatepunaea meridiana]|nr:hypothetical protein [Candidatus Hatepunaea meridiana]
MVLYDWTLSVLLPLGVGLILPGLLRFIIIRKPIRKQLHAIGMAIVIAFLNSVIFEKLVEVKWFAEVDVIPVIISGILAYFIIKYKFD